ncbi:MAG: MFS transporter [Candidatus Azotimanducaceae bacterium]
MSEYQNFEEGSLSKGKDKPKLVTLAVLHMAQYFPAAFTAVALPFLFRKEGLPLEMFWLLALPGYTRFLKWLMALVVDNYGSTRLGKRKSWIIPCTAIGALSYALLALYPPSLISLHIIVGILIFKSFVMAAQDIAVDAYAAETMTDEERPLGTSLINYLGAVAGLLGTGSIVVVEYFGWATAMLAASAMLVIAALPAILRTEPPPPALAEQKKALGQKPSFMTVLKQRDSMFIMPFLFMFGFGPAFLGSMVGAFWADQGLSIEEFGILSATATGAGGLLAALSVPWLAERIGLAKTAMISMVFIPFQAIMYMYFSELGIPAWSLLLPTYIFIAWVTSFYGYAASISRFRWVSKGQAGTDYAVQSSIWNLGVSGGASLSGFAAAYLGWTLFFPLAAIVLLMGAVYYVVMYELIEKTVRIREKEEMIQALAEQ